MTQPLDNKAAHKRSAPERRCIVTGERAGADGFIRFARSPEGEATPDFSAKLPGRGAWVSARRDTVEEAVRRKAFARAFKAPTSAPAGLADAVEAGLRRLALSALGVARRTGDAVIGFEKVRAGLAVGKFEALIVAKDAAEGGVRKISSQMNSIPVVRVFDGRELATALGRDATFVGLKRGAAAMRFATAVERFEDYAKEPAPAG